MGKRDGLPYGHAPEIQPAWWWFADGIPMPEDDCEACHKCTFCGKCTGCDVERTVALQQAVLADAAAELLGMQHSCAFWEDWQVVDRQVIGALARLSWLGRLSCNPQGVIARSYSGMSALYIMTTPCERWCKVGISRDPWKRLRTLQAGSPVRLRVHSRFWIEDDASPSASRGAQELEAAVHAALDCAGVSRGSGGREWFLIEPDRVWQWIDGARTVMERVRSEVSNG